MTEPLPQRALAMLRDVEAGRAQMTCSCVPSLYVDGLCVCDQLMAAQLVDSGFIQPVTSSVVLGQRVCAELSNLGRTALAATGTMEG